MIRIIVVSIIAAAGLACLVLAWLENARLTRQLNHLGSVYGCARWPEESNQHYHMRLRARIDNHWREP